MRSLAKVVSAVEGQFRGTTEATTEADDPDPSPPEGPQPALFQCLDCESVYVAIDKQSCATCDATVEEIPSTLSQAQ